MRRNQKLFLQLRFRARHMAFVATRGQQDRGKQVMHTRQMRIFLDRPPKLRYRTRLKIRLAIRTSECQVDLRFVPKRFLHLGKNPHGTFFVAQIETSHRKIVAVGECRVEIDG